jgi:serine/threonine-protein kinase
VVVLPFHNRGQAEDDYFADGITEEITGRLTSIAQLGVIARTSAMQYKETSKTIRDIGQELNVSYVVEGTIDWRKPGNNVSQVKVSPSLIRVSDEETIWRRDYDVPLENVLLVQGSIAEGVASALDIALEEPTRRRLTEQPTENVEAYDFYLRGNNYYNRSWERADVDNAIRMYQRAVALDSGFAPAFAALGRTHAWFYQLYYDRTPARLDSARVAIDRAIALDSLLPAAWLAFGLYRYWGHRDYDRAVEAFDRARRLQPGNAMVFNNIANVRRRQGLWEETIANYRLAAEFDPRSHVILFNLGEALALTRQYDDADRELERVVTLLPEFIDAHVLRATIAIHRDQNPSAARAILEQAATQVAPGRWRQLVHHWRLGLFRIVDPGPDGLVARVRPGEYGIDSAAYYLAKGDAWYRAGQSAAARAVFDTARAALERLVARNPEQAATRSELGIAYAGLGRFPDAIASAEQAVTMLPSSSDALDGPDLLVNLARVYLMAGRPDDALDRLEQALCIPSRISGNWLRQDPFWIPLRNHPRFQRLVASGCTAGGAPGRRPNRSAGG